MEGPKLVGPTATGPKADGVTSKAKGTTRKILPERKNKQGSRLVTIKHLSFREVFGFYGYAIFIVATVSALWSTLIIALNVAPNETVNYLMKTAEYDDGNFWLLSTASPVLVGVTAGCFSIIACFYWYVVYAIIFYRSRRIIAEEEKSCKRLELSQPKFIAIMTSTGSALWFKCVWKDVTGYEGKYRKIWNTVTKVGDLIMEYITLIRMMEGGFPVEVLCACTALITLNCLSYASIILRGRHISAFREVMIDCVFDMMIAVGFPILTLLICYRGIHLDHDMHALATQIYPAGSFELLARLHVGPSHVAQFRVSIEGLRINSVSDFLIQFFCNAAFMYRLKRVTDVLMQKSLRKMRAKRSLEVINYQKKVPKVLALFFVVAGVGIILATLARVQLAQYLCGDYPECVAYAYRSIFYRDEGVELTCPCIAIVDDYRAPKNYQEWANPKDVYDSVDILSQAGYVRNVMLMNRRLLKLPPSMKNCKYLEELILIYTETSELPYWPNTFSRLRSLQVEGKPFGAHLQRIEDNFFDDMGSLICLHLGTHLFLEKIPSFDGLVQLEDLTLAVNVGMRSLPSFKNLGNLKKMKLVALRGLETLSDMSPLKSLRKLTIYSLTPLCCNGFLGTCNLDDAYCTSDNKTNLPPPTCISNSSMKATESTLSQFAVHKKSVCQPTPQAYLDSFYTFTPEFVDFCEGVMYRQCRVELKSEAGVRVHEGICVSSRMMPISCSSNIYSIEYRRQQIALGIGEACDPAVEGWLGCTSNDTD